MQQDKEIRDENLELRQHAIDIVFTRVCTIISRDHYFGARKHNSVNVDHS